MDYNIHSVQTEDGLIGFESGSYPFHSKGISKLVQMTAKLILTNIGEDLYDPYSGGNLRKRVSDDPIVIQDETQLHKLAVNVMNKVASIITTDQETIVNPDERLQSLTLIKAYIDWDEQAAKIKYRITAESGKTAVVNMLAGNL